MGLNNVDKILDFAIAREQEAVEFYTQLANRMKNPNMQELFTGFVAEEKRHKEKLQKIKVDKSLIPAQEKVGTLNMSDYLVDVEITPEMDYQDALIIAMKKEKAAFRLYSDLANRSTGSIKALFEMLAQEEAKHKLYFELEYDDHILHDN